MDSSICGARAGMGVVDSEEIRHGTEPSTAHIERRSDSAKHNSTKRHKSMQGCGAFGRRSNYVGQVTYLLSRGSDLLYSTDHHIF